MNYDGRGISRVAVWGITLNVHPDTTSISGTAGIQLTDQHGGEDGPEAHFTLSIAVDAKNPTFRDVEHALLDGAVALASRLAKETPESLAALLEEGRTRAERFRKAD